MNGGCRIALLGATGHIGRALAHTLNRDQHDLTLVVRDAGRGRELAASTGLGEGAVARFDDLSALEFDALVNCTGVGDPAIAAEHPATVYSLTEMMDALCLGYLEKQPTTVLVNMSSGAVYGGTFEDPAGDAAVALTPVNALGAGDHYALAKLASEGRHRAASALSIVDLRVFGFFSRYADLTQRFLVNEAIRCTLEGRVFETGPGEVWRDYASPRDLARLVEHAAASVGVNDAFDVVSQRPVAKSALLDAFSSEFALEWTTTGDVQASPTGVKRRYYSTSQRAVQLGWQPDSDALEAVLQEARAIIGAERDSN